MTSRNRSASSTTRRKTSATAPASPDDTQGPRSITFADLHEDDWRADVQKSWLAAQGLALEWSGSRPAVRSSSD
jgi:hypothetical protein